MIALPIALMMLGFLGATVDGDVNIGLGGPMLVDLFAWYIVGAYLGVLPTV